MAGDTNVQVEILAKIDQLISGVDKVNDKLGEIGEKSGELGEGLSDLKNKFMEAFAIDQIVEFVEKMAELGEQAVRLSSMLGMPIEKVQELGFAARMVGGEAESMGMSMMRLERNMAEAQDGSSKAAKAFEALGISQAQLKNSSPDQVLGLIANAFHGAKDGADKTAIAMDLMGRAGAQMIPLLNQGSEGLEKMGMLAKSTGSILTEMQAEGLEKTAQSITVLKASTEGAGIALMETFKPAIDAVITGLTAVVQVITAMIRLINVAVEAIEGGMLLALAKVIEKAEEMGVQISAMFNTMKLKAEEVMTVIDLLVHGHLQAAVDAQNKFEQQIAADAKKAITEVANLQKEYQTLKEKIEAATEAAIKNTLNLNQNKKAEGEDKNALHAPTGGAGKADNYDADLQDAKNYFDYVQTMSRIDLENKKSMDQLKVASGAMSKQQELEDLAKFTLQEEDLDLKAAQQEADLYDQDTVEYTKAMEKKAEIAAKYNAKISQIQYQAAAAQQAQWKQLMTSMNSAFDGMVNGVLQGTQTWQQGLARMFSNIALKFIDDVVLKMIENWAMGLARQIGLTQAFNSVMAALGLEQVTTSAGIQAAANAAKNTATMTSDAALAYAGVFANQAPLLGPAASVPAAAASASILALIPEASMAVGAWDLDRDMVAQLHQGEMVVPTTYAEGMRNGGGMGGGDSYSITIQAIDTQTGANFLKNNAAIIAKNMSGQVKKFNRSFPAWKQ